MAEYIRRRVPKDNGVALVELLAATELGRRFPAILEFLTLQEWEPDVPRVTGSLTLFRGDNCLQACIADKDRGQVAFVSGRSLEELLGAVEEGLRDDALDWRRGRENGGGRVRKSS